MVFFIRCDDRNDPAVLHAERPHVHAFSADPHAAVAKYAARAIEIHHGRPLLLVLVVLGLHEFGLGRSIRESHILQFAFAARVAYRAIERMIAEQHLEHRFASLANFLIIGGDGHGFADDRGAGGLQLRHFLDLHQAHAASALQREIGVIAKGGHFDADRLAGLDEQGAGGRGNFLAVDREAYFFGCVCHESFFLSGATPLRVAALSLPLFQTGTVFLPGGPQIPF